MSQTLAIAFSYSLEADGSPGKYNHTIAGHLLDWRRNRGASDDILAGQWEIKDALADLLRKNPDMSLANHFDALFAVSPPLFAGGDVVDPDEFVRRLKKPDSIAARMLADAVGNLLTHVGYEESKGSKGRPAFDVFDHACLNAERIALYLNQLLDDENLFTRIFAGDDPHMQFHHLIRPDLGSIGVEVRELPKAGVKLGKYQLRRVNRLFVEAVVPDAGVLKRGSYLSTQGVLDRVLDRFNDKLPDVDEVVVFGFPAHAPRCRRQLIEAIWRKGYRIAAGQAKIFEDCDVEPSSWTSLKWDPSTAQVWCRSLQNWLDYERKGIKRL